MANVKARIILKARVCVYHDTSGPREGQQWHNIHRCVTGAISLSEWNWRFSAASEILCSGTTSYASYGDAVGEGWL